MHKKVRVRFAPSPTGYMHIGGVRVALLNYLFAHKNKGTFVLRIEDTDQKRNLNEVGLEILEDLKWLGLKYEEGPFLDGKFGPYYQSKRTDIYQKQLDALITNQKVYRCFCSPDELESKRILQLEHGKPPRYDRTCLHLSDDMIKQKLVNKVPFIWRMKINDDQTFEIDEMARGKIVFDMKNFSDFALTRQDGSFTFLFSNFVDDWLMQITHVIRGDDHLSNTALQAVLYDAFSVQMPRFWHLPLICSIEGKKLSKRDFGFSLQDLRADGYLPEAICNYLAVIGGSFEQEIQSLGELAQNFDFENIHSTGAIHFDAEKLAWFNHKWIQRLAPDRLLEFAKPFLHEQIPASKNIDDAKMAFILGKVRTDLKTLKEVGAALEFYFHAPKVEREKIENEFGKDKVEIFLTVLNQYIDEVEKDEFFLKIIKEKCKERGLKTKEIFEPLRYLLTGKFSGPSIHDLFEILGDTEIKSRLKNF